MDAARVLVMATILGAPWPLAAQSSAAIAVPTDSPRWQLQGKAAPAEYLGRRCLMLDGGAAVVGDLRFRDGIIDVDVATSAPRGFFGIQFRIAGDGMTAEEVYLRQHKSGQPDAMQYTPVLGGGRNWQIYNGPGFTGAVAIPKDTWFHLRLEVTGAQARLFVGDSSAPALTMHDLKSGLPVGEVALMVLTGATCFSNFQVRLTPEAPWERRQPPVPAGTLARWSLSPSYDALARNLEAPLSAAERDRMRWEEVEAEPPGFVVISRYRRSPQLRVSFQGDFARRLEPQPGMTVVYARTTIQADRAEVRRLLIGYSDDVSVFLNGRILYRGRSAQGFRDPAFLGIVNPENDVVYLQLQPGANELVLAVSELGGGWGFICRLEPLAS